MFALTEKQLAFCDKEADKPAKLLLDKNVKHIFGDYGNANFALHTLMILVGGCLGIMTDKSPFNDEEVCDIFIDMVKNYIGCVENNSDYQDITH